MTKPKAAPPDKAPNKTPDSAAPKTVGMTVTFLHMHQRSVMVAPTAPKEKVAILRADHPPVHFYRYLYNAVGGPWLWVERRKMSDETLSAIITNPLNELYVLYVAGCPAGMGEIDFRKPDTAQIAYFGLVPDYIGRRLGYFFLYHVVANAWSRAVHKVTVNTCTLDHPRALPLYQRMGFTPYSREDRYIELP
ncbi:MAG: GNAT family N-acetyltransferase [Rhizomicrobium sp.]